MTSFAKAQLLKYGWTEGKGLGKNENGIVDALRPKLKFDNTGIGHDAKEFKWWESVYDRAAGNVAIERGARADEISVTTKAADSVVISTDKPSLLVSSSESRLGYKNFLKTCTLDGGKVVREEATERVSEMPEFVELTDEQLFEACGGRTAHKGARHGLKLSGKLARVARQEALVLESNAIPERIDEEWTEVESKRKKSKRKRRRSVAEMDIEVVNDPPSTHGNAATSNPLVASPKIPKSRESSKKKKRHVTTEEDASPSGNLAEEITIETIDGAVITLDEDDDARDTPGARNFTEAERANFLIRKNKKKSVLRKAKKRLDRLSDSLMTVSLSEDSVEPEQLPDVAEVSKKSKKRRRKRKLED